MNPLTLHEERSLVLPARSTTSESPAMFPATNTSFLRGCSIQTWPGTTLHQKQIAVVSCSPWESWSVQCYPFVEAEARGAMWGCGEIRGNAGTGCRVGLSDPWLYSEKREGGREREKEGRKLSAKPYTEGTQFQGVEPVVLNWPDWLLEQL